MTADPSRALEDCPLVIFIAYTVPASAEPGGYSDWLRRVDMPFFNAIPGTRHYANWRLRDVQQGAVPVWDYFDFQGLETEADLERVWFNPDLDAFRSEWLRLWGYGRAEAPPVLRHSYLMRPVFRTDRRPKDAVLTLAGGTGAAPSLPDADLVWQVEDVLHKHFGGSGQGASWKTPAFDANPLALDWLAVRHGVNQFATAPATLRVRADLIAAPDRA
ncbi:hypothetical protein [Puniceibacterium sp. IMCC21224]|uniref:hypothetical protein n=1 Tax=Puniceibacterium sp. IMCC21224 TaxID=1618204 RepID=UPI00064DAEB0|nr:hypothetical protein [Puniceibacterium sp. IMCC21224]KMK64922.1 hypothetical protein IMCC21224_12167 [Puniceibacterium sp. IMCC21224]